MLNKIIDIKIFVLVLVVAVVFILVLLAFTLIEPKETVPVETSIPQKSFIELETIPAADFLEEVEPSEPGEPLEVDETLEVQFEEP